jgi:hypothetical protein
MGGLGQDASNVNPLALLFLLGASLVMLKGRRQVAVSAVLAIAAFLPLGQQVVVLGLHFTFLRILILVGLGRVLINGEIREVKLNGGDKILTCWALVGFVCGVLRKPEAWAGADSLGSLYNSLGVYFLFRFLIRSPDEVIAQLRFLAFAAVVISLAMVVELISHKNPFYVFGGVPQFEEVRDGRFRCQGPFRHPILAGTFPATLFPLLVGLWLEGGRKKWIAILGVIGSAFATVAAASSGAVLTFIGAIIGLSLWRVRYRMHIIRRGVVVVIIGLALVMKVPVWYLIAKASNLVGGTGWHRSYLIDQAVGHFSEWWLIGSSYTAHWAPSGEVLTVDPNNMDITNQYIAQGLQGGVLGLGLFIAFIVTCFKAIGRFMRSVDETLPHRKLAWALGVGLAAHCTAFISISYFDQSIVFLFWLWAAIASVPAWQSEAVSSVPLANTVGSVETENLAVS